MISRNLKKKVNSCGHFTNNKVQSNLEKQTKAIKKKSNLKICPELDTEVKDKKETKRQKQVDLLENRHDWAGISSSEHAGETRTQTASMTAPCTRQSRCNAAGPKRQFKPHGHVSVNTARINKRCQCKHVG